MLRFPNCSCLTGVLAPKAPLRGLKHLPSDCIPDRRIPVLAPKAPLRGLKPSRLVQYSMRRNSASPQSPVEGIETGITGWELISA